MIHLTCYYHSVLKVAGVEEGGEGDDAGGDHGVDAGHRVLAPGDPRQPLHRGNLKSPWKDYQCTIILHFFVS